VQTNEDSLHVRDAQWLHCENNQYILLTSLFSSPLEALMAAKPMMALKVILILMIVRVE
jgi:hypothetical protein